MYKIRHLQAEDKEFLFKLDKHLSEEEFVKKVKDKMGYIIFTDNRPVGVLRFNLFWDSIPFCTMLYIDSDKQKCGYGKALLQYWENEMKLQGYKLLMTSTQSDETAQHFYRKMGYQDAGCLLLNSPHFAQPMEMFFTKDI